MFESRIRINKLPDREIFDIIILFLYLNMIKNLYLMSVKEEPKEISLMV